MIRVLPGNIANLIAAGEVVQRPASVVKELMENAVDAGATQVSVVIRDSGRTLIQVIDNGCGMSPDEAEICFERHATSKIATAEDLSEIMTFGFRGEALASIAAVAQVTLKTRREEDEVGTVVEMAASQIAGRTSAACPKGTNIAVRDIFYNVPARRKFLKSDNVEFKHIVDEFTRVSITRPQVSFTLTHNDREIFVLHSAKMLKYRIQDLLGASAVDKVVSMDTQTSVARISGFLGRPDLSTKTAGKQFFFVNGRFFRSAYFHKAVMKAYENLVAPGTVPSYFLFLECPPESVDVNISPTKTEVKFENDSVIFQVLYASVHEALGRNSFGSAMDFDTAGVPEMPVLGKDFESFRGEIGAPDPAVDPLYDPFAQTGGIHDPFSGESAGPDGSGSFQSPDSEGIANGYHSPGTDGFTPASFGGQQAMADRSYAGTPSGFRQTCQGEGGFPQGADYRTGTYSGRTGDCGQLFDGMNVPTSSAMVLDGRFIVTRAKSGLLLVHIARARERILYERFLKAVQANDRVCQTALFPVQVTVGTENRLVFDEHSALLQSLGFDITPFGTDTIVVGGVPEGFPCERAAVEALMADLLRILEDCPEMVKGMMESAIAEKLAAAGAARGERITSPVQAQRLIDQVFSCDNPEYTTKGHRIMSILSTDEIEKKF